MSKSIDEIVYNFRNDLIKYFGEDAGLLKITLTHELFDQVMMDLFRKKQGRRSEYSYLPSSMSDFQLFGIRIEARAKEQV